MGDVQTVQGRKLFVEDRGVFVGKAADFGLFFYAYHLYPPACEFGCYAHYSMRGGNVKGQQKSPLRGL